jgi:hypothetical protein
MKEKAIKSIVNQTGWQYIEEVFIDEIIEGKKALNFKTEGKTAEMIAIDVIARERASKMILDVLKKLKRIANKEEYKKESFK